MTSETLTKIPSHANSVISTLPSEASTQMGFAADALVHLMSVLTDLYSNPNLAVLREYATNALDSHVAAGNPDPIEITMPTRLEPTFTVRDHGTGMSKEDIIEIYSRYGASTKRNDLNQVGAFGLGCKSALTLTQQFTLVSVKDGQRSVVVISRDENGAGNVSIVSHTATDESNGVTVTIPIPEVWRFLDSSRNFFFTWKPGTVLVDGKQPESIYDEGYIHTDDVFFSTGSYGSGVPSLIIGGIAYPVDQSAVPWASRPRVNAYVETPIGAVDLTPSREALRYSERTKRYIAQATQRVSEKVTEAARNHIENAPNRAEALKAWNHWRGVFAEATSIEWNSEQFPENIQEDLAVQNCTVADGKRSKWATTPQVPLSAVMHGAYYFVGLDDTERDRLNRSLNLAFKEMGKEYAGTFLVFASEPKSKWVTENEAMIRLEADDIFNHAKVARSKARKAAAAVPKEERRVVRTTYFVASFNDANEIKAVESRTVDAMPADILVSEASTTSRFISTNDLSRPGALSYLKRFSEEYSLKGKTVVLLRPGQSVSALMRRLHREPTNPIMNVTRWRHEQDKKMAESISDEVKAYLSIWWNGRYGDNGARALLESLYKLRKIKDQVKDARLHAVIDAAVIIQDLRRSGGERIYSNGSSLWRAEEKVTDKVRRDLATLSQKYAFLCGTSHLMRSMDKKAFAQHALAYVNAIYTSN